jgi:hypothetical protein
MHMLMHALQCKEEQNGGWQHCSMIPDIGQQPTLIQGTS